MICPGASGAGIPQSSVVREIERILQSAFDEAHDLVAALGRQNEAGIILVELQELVLVFGEPEEIGLLLRPLDRRPLRPKPDAVRAEHGFAFGVEGLVADRIPPLITCEIDVARLLHAAPNLGHGTRGGEVRAC